MRIMILGRSAVSHGEVQQMELELELSLQNSVLTVEIGLVNAVLSDTISHLFELQKHKARLRITITVILYQEF